MSDTTRTDKTLRVGQRKPLSLKRDTDTVRQSFSGGRVEGCRRREEAHSRCRPGEASGACMPPPKTRGAGRGGASARHA